MEFKKVMNVRADQLYDAILDSISYEAKISKKKVVKGFSYTKEMKTKMSAKGNILVTIEDLEENRIYAARFSSAQGENYLKYEINEIDENKIEVTYTEGFEGSSKSKTLNYKLLNSFYRRSFNKKTNTTLENIENWILSNSNNEN